MTNAREIRPGVVEIDTLFGGWQQRTAGYVLTGDAPVLIETGTQLSVPVVLAELAELGLGANDLAAIALTHIHLDHAGGIGEVAAAFPKATVYVHELGARHLVDPSRLVASAERVYGELLDELYGRIAPTPAERVVVMYDADTIEVGGGRLLRAIDSPGHAKHHLGFLDSASGLLFAGDAVGVKFPDGGVLRPATPPADFDYHDARHSLRRFKQFRPEAIALAHYGLIATDPDELLTEAEERLTAWTETARRAFESGGDIEEALRAAFDDDFSDLGPQERERVETLNGIHSNAAGLRRYFETTKANASSEDQKPG